MIKTLWPQMYSVKTIAIMEGVMMDSTKNIELRKTCRQNVWWPLASRGSTVAPCKGK
jgi:hypothetical protein